MSADRPPTFNADHVRRFLAEIIPDPSIGCTEVRIFRASFERNYIVPDERYSKTLGGWFNDPVVLAIDLRRLKDVSAYVTVNPVRSDLLARVDHRIVTLKKGNGTCDDDIICLRHLYLDIDPKRPTDMSATDEELALAIARRDQILADFPLLAASSIWGCSGNGGFGLTRLPDYPNDERHRKLIAKALAALSTKYSDDLVTVDVKTKNPARVMVIPGTFKCKGSDKDHRPWRLATLDSPEGREGRLEPFDLVGWVVEHVGVDWEKATAEGKPPKEEGKSRGNGHTDRAAQHRGTFDLATKMRHEAAYLAGKPPSVCGNQECHDKAIDAACELIKGFDLDPMSARPILVEWMGRNPSHVWTESEIDHKVEDADKIPDDKPRGWKLTEERNGHGNDTGYTNGFPNGYVPVHPRFDARQIPPPTGRKNKPVIFCRDISLSISTGEALKVLAKHNKPPEIFNFGGMMSWIKRTATKEARAFIELMSHDALRNRLANFATFIEIWETKHGKNEVEVFPPMAIVRAVAAQKDWDLEVAPPLEMVVESPRFLPSGKLVTTAGYNDEAYIYYHPQTDLDLDKIPESPTDQDILEAKSLIFNEYLYDFPFDSQASKANALACMLLPFVRLMIDGPTPLHVFEASTEGTGKGKLANACAFPSVGRELSSTSQKEDEAEWRKTLTTTLQAGGSHVYIDNLYNPRVWDGSLLPIDSANLALVLTQPEWVDRILGGNRQARIKVQCVWMASGNNLEWSKELARRVVPIRLKVMLEDPSDREGFKCEPLTLEEWAREHRNKLLRACLILCQSWIAKDKPPGSQRMGSYENYSKVMGGILKTCGVPGFLENRRENTSKDRESLRWPVFVEAWHAMYGEKLVSSNDLHMMIFGGFRGVIKVEGDAELQIAFADIVGDKSPLSQKQKLGRAMAKQEDRVYVGFRITRNNEKSVTGNSTFRLSDISQEDGYKSKEGVDNTQVIEDNGVNENEPDNDPPF